MTIPADSPSAFYFCTFGMLGKLASADGKVSRDERRKVEDYMVNTLQLGRKQKKLAMDIFNEALESPLRLQDYAIQFHKSFPDRVQLHDRMIEILVEVSVADGVLSLEEDKMIRSAALLLELSEPHYERVKAKFVAPEAMTH